ncbi:MFS transporter [Ochrobactrum sp. BTU1]|uniref:MFS transporter n=1 Tax=Ochrobactrum sp. BTU1 TaxID=2840456 RepID=UPI001C055082|nr:MFS transporter [Ochrobactrum sp. BTU1]
MDNMPKAAEVAIWRDNRAVALLMAATLTVMANATISPALPGLQHLFVDEPHSELLTRLLVTAPSLSIALLAPLVGLVVDRIGRRVPLLVGIILFVIAGSAGLYLPDLLTIFLSRIVLGVAVAFIMTAQTALIGDYFSGEIRSTLTGLQISARNFGGLVLILLAGLVATVSPRWVFGVYGLALLVLPLAWAAIVEPRRSLDVGRASHLPGSEGKPKWALLFFGLVILQSVTNMFFFIMPTQLPFFLDAQGYSSASMTGMTLSLLMLSGGTVALAYSRIQRTIGYAGVYAFGYAAMASGFLLLLNSGEALFILAGAALIGAGYAAVSPTFVALTLAMAPQHRRGLAGGILTSSVFAGQFISPLLSTPVIMTAGYDGLFECVTVLLASMAIIVCAAIRYGARETRS